jgi:hypothetical protein
MGTGHGVMVAPSEKDQEEACQTGREGRCGEEAAHDIDLLTRTIWAGEKESSIPLSLRCGFGAVHE